MTRFLLTLHLWGFTLLDHAVGAATHTWATARASRSDRRARPQRGERGSVTIEQVIWAGAVIVIVGIVVAAITSYVKSEAGKIN